MKNLLTFLKGFLVGIANIIPGVSGGTFALILGIYERLIACIGSLRMKTISISLKALISIRNPTVRQTFLDELRHIDALWLGILLLGAGGSILASSRLITFLLDEHLAPTLSFFIGLIVPSVMVPYQMLKRKGWKELLSCLVATAGLVGLSLVLKSNPGQGSTHMSMLFLSGAISISAMILPGISGSFILLLLGEYKTILEAINHWELPKLTVFALGCLLGIIAFVKLLQFLLKRFHSVTMAFLIGLILGSLWILWPFKTVPAGAKIIQGSNILPPGFNPEVWWSLGALVVGLICSMGLTYLGKLREEKTEPEATSTT